MDQHIPSFGVWHDFRQRLPWSDRYSRFYAECLDEIALAEQLGFSHIWLSENHFVDDGYLPSALVTAAAVAAQTSRIQIGTNIIVLPLYHPLHIAEDSAVIDLLSDGRLTLGVGVGYVQNEFETFGVNRRHRAALLEEGITIIRQAWDEGNIRFAGQHWSFNDLPFAPQPERRIPIYIGGAAPAAIDRAARLADGFLASRNFATAGNAGYVESHRLLESALKRHGRASDEVSFVVCGHVYLHEDAEQAWRDVAPGLAFQVNQYLRWGTDRERPRPQPVRVEDLNPANYFIGDPQRVAARLIDLYHEAPYGHLCFWGRLPGLSHDQARHSLELFAERVAPVVQEAVAGG